jgi:uncharacterized repeat protein (TIGR01451 family)
MHPRAAVVSREAAYRVCHRIGVTLLAISAGVLLSVSGARAAAPANLTIRATARTFFVGYPGTYHVTVGNRGPSTTDDVVTVSDVLPPGLSFVSSSGPWNCGARNGVVTCTNTVPLPVGSSTFVLVVNVDAAAVPRVTNQLTLSYAGDTTPINNTITKFTSARLPRFAVPTPLPTATPPPVTAPPTSGHQATATATVTPVPAVTDLKLTKTLGGTFTVGFTGNYLLTVTNLGAATTNTAITVVDTLPASLGFVSAGGSGWTCSASGQTVTCVTSNAVAPLATTSFTLTVNVTAAAYPSVTNSATLSYAGDNNAANNTAFRPTTIRSS